MTIFKNKMSKEKHSIIILSHVLACDLKMKGWSNSRVLTLTAADPDAILGIPYDTWAH